MQPILKTTEELEKYLEKLNNSKVIFLDTEFKRRDTYFPILCLIQLSVAGEIVLIDPSIKDCKLDPLIKVLSDHNILKVLHSARQDLEILYFYTKDKPIGPIFDTQVAAAFCGLGLSVSYESLVNDFMNVALDKSQRITDWEKRPLSDKQIKYALNDVLYLPQIYERLEDTLTKKGYNKYYKEEALLLEDHNNFQISDEKLLKKIKFDSKDPQKIAKLLRLIKWREKLAAKLNINRAQIISDVEIYLLVFKFSASSIFEELDEDTALTIKNLLTAPPAEDEQIRAKAIIKKKFSSQLKLNRNLCKVILQLVAIDSDIAESIIATSDDLNYLVQHDLGSDPSKEMRIMKGWRYEIYGKTLEDFCSGHAAIRIEGPELTIVKAHQLH